MSDLYSALQPGSSQPQQPGSPASAGSGPVLPGAQQFQQGLQQGGSSGLWHALIQMLQSKPTNPPQANSGLQQGPPQISNPSSSGPVS